MYDCTETVSGLRRVSDLFLFAKKATEAQILLLLGLFAGKRK